MPNIRDEERELYSTRIKYMVQPYMVTPSKKFYKIGAQFYITTKRLIIIGPDDPPRPLEIKIPLAEFDFCEVFEGGNDPYLLVNSIKGSWLIHFNTEQECQRIDSIIKRVVRARS